MNGRTWSAFSFSVGECARLAVLFPRDCARRFYLVWFRGDGLSGPCGCPAPSGDWGRLRGVGQLGLTWCLRDEPTSGACSGLRGRMRDAPWGGLPNGKVHGTCGWAHTSKCVRRNGTGQSIKNTHVLFPFSSPRDAPRAPLCPSRKRRVW